MFFFVFEKSTRDVDFNQMKPFQFYKHKYINEVMGFNYYTPKQGCLVTS